MTIEFGGKVVNHWKADPDRDDENTRILRASCVAASLHWMMNRLICSTVDVSSVPENLVKSGIL